jgi:SWI/SNF-related matrix-associated actin-dependent regulator of chromatin subfamily A member 5
VDEDKLSDVLPDSNDISRQVALMIYSFLIGSFLMAPIQVSERPDEDASMHSASEGEESEMDELESDVEQAQPVRILHFYPS